MNTELNERIAVEVMGYHWHTDKYLSVPRLARTVNKTDDQGNTYPWNELMLGGVPDYSGNIAAAWQVVEEMISRNYELGELQFDKARQWFCIFERDTDHEYGFSQAQPTAPLAICLAALDIVGKIKAEAKE